MAETITIAEPAARGNGTPTTDCYDWRGLRLCTL